MVFETMKNITIDNKYKLSLIIPCYNAEKYLPELIISIILQTVSAHEILFVDDGSTDSSFEILTSAAIGKIIRHKENKGLAIARNTGFRKATGNIIAYVDADTILQPDFIETILNCYYLYPEMAGIGGCAEECHIENIYDYWRSKNMLQSFGKRIITSAPMLWGVCSSYRKDVLLEMNGFSEMFLSNGEDVDMGIRCKKKGFKLLYHPLIKVSHYKNDSEISLKKAVYRWYYWGAIAQRKNHHYPLFGLLKILLTQFLYKIPYDNKEYRKLDFQLLVIKIKAIFDSCAPHVRKPIF